MALALTLEDVFTDARSKRRDPNLNDEVLASEVVVAMRQFEDAVNAAASAGLVIETRFDRVENCLPGAAARCVANVQMYRRPS